MATDLNELSERIEECYEFTLSFAARGISGEVGSDTTRQVKEQLQRSLDAMHALKSCCTDLLQNQALEPRVKYENFFAAMEHDAAGASAAMELVMELPAIGSQVIDNLNASIHLRALLADLFLLTEILENQRVRTAQ